MARDQSAPSMDYEELKRRHAEFKAQQRMKSEQAKPEEPVQASEPAPEFAPAEPKPEHVSETRVSEAAPVQEDITDDSFEDEAPAFDRAEDSYDEYEGDSESANNPFSSILGALGKIKGKFSGIRKKKADDVIDDSDEYGYADEEEPEEKHGEFKLFRRAKEEPREEEADEAEAPSEAEDVPEPEDAPAEAEAYEAHDSVEYDGDAEDEEYEDDEEEPRGKSGLKKFVSLFIVKEEALSDEEFESSLYETGDAEDEDEQDAPDEPVRNAPTKPAPQYDDSLFVRKSAPLEDKGGYVEMDEQKKTAADITDLMSEGLGEKTLSRRERRELAAKQAASAEKLEANIDEPTREYKPVQRPASYAQTDEQPRARKSAASYAEEEDDYADARGSKKIPARYDDDEDDYTPSRRQKKAKPVYDDEDYDDYGESPKSKKSVSRYDDEYEFDEPKPAKKSKSRYDDEDDYDEPKPAKKSKSRYDDDEDDYDEPKPAKKSKSRYDDDEDDYDEPKPAKKSKSRYDDDEDDEYDDYDDDEYDEEPRRRSRRSDDDDYDDDDDEPGAGHYVLGFFKILIGVILVLVIALFGMYFADHIKEGGFAPYRWISEKVPFINEVLKPESTEAPDAADETAIPGFGVTDPEATAVPEATDTPEATDAPDAAPTDEAPTDAPTQGTVG